MQWMSDRVESPLLEGRLIICASLTYTTLTASSEEELIILKCVETVIHMASIKVSKTKDSDRLWKYTQVDQLSKKS